MYGNFTCIVVEIRLTGIQKAGLRTKIYLILLKNLINSALSYRWAMQRLEIGSPAKTCVTSLTSAHPEPTAYRHNMEGCSLQSRSLSTTQGFHMISLRRGIGFSVSGIIATRNAGFM